MAEITVGQPAPDFTLPSHLGDNFTLSSLIGQKSAVLLFYVLDFTGG
ncbi:MAG: redoxin domain-containing protein [Chloroflexi bacterium]|nr:redoxin domain-containing protein [Chloroflexota bacterium]